MALTSFNFPAPQIVYSPQPLYRPAFPSAPIPAGPDPNTIKKKLSLMNSVKAGSFLAVQTVALGSLIGLAVDLIRPRGINDLRKLWLNLNFLCTYWLALLVLF